MTAHEVVQLLQADCQLPSRYPTRLVFIESFSAYKVFLRELEKITDTNNFMEIGDFCPASDKYPAKHKLDEAINQKGENALVLLSVGEYLRTAVYREKSQQRILLPIWEAQQSENSRRRIIIPLFACKALFDNIIARIDERQKDFIYSVDGEAKRINVTFYSPEFKDIFGKDTQGIQAYLHNWSSLFDTNDSIRVITSQYPLIEKSATSVYVDTQNNVFEYLRTIAKGFDLIQDWGLNEQWAYLTAQHKKSESLMATINKQLNVGDFKPASIIGLWDSFEPQQKWLAWLGFRFCFGDDYISYVVKNTKSDKEVEKSLLLSIFSQQSENENWLAEYGVVRKSLKSEMFIDDILSLVDNIPDVAMRLKYLVCDNRKEQAYAIKLASKMLQNGENLSSVAERYKELYPEFYAYLKSSSSLPNEIGRYFSRYVVEKIKNSNSPEFNIGTVDIDNFEARYSEISKVLPQSDAYLFWIDGFGIEWLGLFEYFASKYIIDCECKKTITAARLPTETIFNEQWKEYLPNAEKADRLDKLAHHGIPDESEYYSCVATQIEYIKGFVKTIASKLNSYNTVVISSDHGSSRIAALAFHKAAGISVPHGAKIGAHGRYCEFIEKPKTTEMPTCCEFVARDNKWYYVMKTYDHFAQGGKTVSSDTFGDAGIGEIHGGKTPEELLVPVIIFTRKTPIAKTEPIIRRGIQKNKGGDL